MVVNKRPQFGEAIRELRAKNKMTLRLFFAKAEIEDVISWSRAENGYIPPPTNKELLKILQVFNLEKDQIDDILNKAHEDRKNFQLISEEDYVVPHLPLFLHPNQAESFLIYLKEDYKNIKEQSERLLKDYNT